MPVDSARLVIEVTVAIACLVLVRVMIIPYQLTGEGRYLGLPLGFGSLCLSYVFTIISFTLPFYSIPTLTWLIHLTRTFSFVFFATTYYFSNKPARKTRLLSDLLLSLLIVILLTLSLLLIVVPEFTPTTYGNAQLLIRIIGITCLSYVSIHTLRTHIKNPDITNLWIPLGFILLTLSQVLLLICYFAFEQVALWGGLVLRSAGLAVFLVVSYQIFYRSKEKAKK
jgi:hypothetical protein